MQQLGEFDAKTSTWVKAPSEIRKFGGPLFCDRRFNTVFTYRNGSGIVIKLPAASAARCGVKRVESLRIDEGDMVSRSKSASLVREVEHRADIPRRRGNDTKPRTSVMGYRLVVPLFELEIDHTAAIRVGGI